MAENKDHKAGEMGQESCQTADGLRYAKVNHEFSGSSTKMMDGSGGNNQTHRLLSLYHIFRSHI